MNGTMRDSLQAPNQTSVPLKFSAESVTSLKTAQTKKFAQKSSFSFHSS